MPKNSRYFDPFYLNLVILIFKGINSHSEMNRILDQSVAKIRNSIMWLKKEGVITSNIKHLGRAKGSRGAYKINSDRLIQYILSVILKQLKLQSLMKDRKQMKKIKLSLYQYMFECSKTNKLADISIHDFLKNFVLGIGKGAYFERYYLNKNSKRFSGYCMMYYIVTTSNDYIRIAEMLA